MPFFKRVNSGNSVPPSPDEDLLRTLECPVCKDSLWEPIEQCCNGHSVCGDCRKEVSECPVCRGPLPGTRNRLAEGLTERLLGQACENGDLGCSVRLPAGRRLERHQLSCDFRPFECVFCCKEYPSKDMLEHLRKGHGAVVNGSTCSWTIDKKTGAKCRFYVLVMLVEGEPILFWRRIKGDVAFMGATTCGSTKSEFTFSFECQTHVTTQKINTYGRVHEAGSHRYNGTFKPCEICICIPRILLEKDMFYTVNVYKTQSSEEGKIKNVQSYL